MTKDWMIMRYIFTFGFGHVHPITGTSLRDMYVRSPADLGYVEARTWMVERFSIYWAFQYEDTSADDAGIDEFDLMELTDTPPVQV